jgi:hypothetical protein
LSDEDDTVVRRALIPDRSPDVQPALRRIAASIHVLANVVGGYPTRHTEVWQSPEWQKDLKDLLLACERLREHARELDILAAEPDDDTSRS